MTSGLSPRRTGRLGAVNHYLTGSPIIQRSCCQTTWEDRTDASLSTAFVIISLLTIICKTVTFRPAKTMKQNLHNIVREICFIQCFTISFAFKLINYHCRCKLVPGACPSSVGRRAQTLECHEMLISGVWLSSVFCTVASIKARWTFVRTFVLFGPGWKIEISKTDQRGAGWAAGHILFNPSCVENTPTIAKVNNVFHYGFIACAASKAGWRGLLLNQDVLASSAALLTRAPASHVLLFACCTLNSRSWALKKPVVATVTVCQFRRFV